MMTRSSFEGYKLAFTSQAAKELKKLEHGVSKKINEKLQTLVKGTANLDITKMQGIAETYRLRWGDYRIVFEVHQDIITILVIGVGHRREIYRDY